MRPTERQSTMVNAKFALESFQEAFHDGTEWNAPEPVEEFTRVTAESHYLKFEFTMNARGELIRGSLLFPYFLTDAEANRKITAQVVRFLEVCLPSSVLPEDWIQNATRELKRSEQFESEHLGLVISMTQLKPSLTFLLLAERKGAPKPKMQDGRDDGR